MKIAFFGDSLTRGTLGVSCFGMLEAILPEHELTNHGRNGDTVVSLHRRIARRRFQDCMDIAVLWVGVNDVFAKVTFAHSLLKQLMRQPRATDLIEFRDYYDRTVNLLLQQHVEVILTVSPLLIGEDLLNPWNQELANLCEIVASVSSRFSNVHYVDLHAKFAKQLEGGSSSDYVADSILRIAHDTLSLHTPSQIDTVASGRGLRLTLDGVHLNSAGAEIVAKALQETIRSFS